MIGRWVGRFLSGSAALFLLMDGGMKLFQPPAVVEAMRQLGYTNLMTLQIGVLLIVLTLLYIVPRAALLGALLLTGYLGGAVASQMRIGAPAFSMAFPVIIAAMLWGGLWLRDRSLRDELFLRVTPW